MDLRLEIFSHDEIIVDLDKISVFHHIMPRGKVEEMNIINASRKQGEEKKLNVVFFFS